MIDWQLNAYTVLMFSAAGFAALIAFQVWRRYPAPGSRSGTLLMFCIVDWSLGYAFELGSATLLAKLFWSNVNFIGIVAIPVLWFVFVLRYTHRDHWLSIPRLILLGLPSLVTLLLTWTNPAHKLIRQSAALDLSAKVPMLAPVYGVGYWIFWAYAFFLMIVSSILLLHLLVTGSGLQRGQAIAMCLSALLPWTGNILYLSGFNPLHPLDLTPLSFVFAGLIMLWGVYQFRLLDIVPVAKDIVIRGMCDGVIVLDPRDRILDLNPTAQEILGMTLSRALGEPVVKMLPAVGELLLDVDAVSSTETVLGDEDAARWYNIRVSQLMTNRGVLAGRLAVLYDVTDQKHAQMALRASEAQNRALLDAVPDAIYILDRTGTFLEHKGRGRADKLIAPDAIGKSVDEVVPSNLAQKINQYIQDAKADHAVEQWEYELLSSDEQKSLVFEIRMSVGDEDRMLFMVREITERERAEDALRQRNRELAELNAIAGTIASTLSFEQVLQRIVESVSRLYPDAYGTTIQLLDKNTGYLHTRAASYPLSPEQLRMEFPPGQGIVGVAIQEQRFVNVPDVTEDPRFLPGPIPAPYRSLLVYPLVYHERVLGALSLTHPKVGAFDESAERLIQGISDYAAIAVQNARLFEQTRRDAETKAALLEEVNHRVKNNLSAIIGLLYTERRLARGESRRTYREIIEDMINRIQGLATVHTLLSASEWSPLRLSDLVPQVMRSAKELLPSDRTLLTEVTPSPVRVPPKEASSLALVINELATNTVKYGLDNRDTVRVTVRIIVKNDRVYFEFRDDGPGYPEEVLRMEEYNVGLYLIQNIVRAQLRGNLSLENDGGAVTTIDFKIGD